MPSMQYDPPQSPKLPLSLGIADIESDQFSTQRITTLMKEYQKISAVIEVMREHFVELIHFKHRAALFEFHTNQDGSLKSRAKQAELEALAMEQYDKY